ncbi:MAG: chromosome segregation protein SMC [Gammaproteobacteria bacterium]|nr:chromosome segregation protein SMC [Gammaproteobacteria bacterium]
MQLSKIKLSGFKSFVDPTSIMLPSKLVAIVGPNGCGKSNVIDAVTWVMGESSPKYLRGESLTDIIFNGSSARKPVGQASVELVFDNSDGTLGGEYAKFSEISVKRTLGRESDSTYYLNGVRCRKKDVVDLFLGTGLGPRSYSIIGQNMISRVIEAKPDELRTYLEEAAGISKYKERRHETELRIQHTNENLSRVNDLTTELTKQLSHLKHQANVAEKFKTLKQQERVFRAELLCIQWRFLDSKMVNHTLQIQRAETALEARNSEIASTDREIEQIRHEQRVAHDALQEVQRRYYSISNEITRIEQDILHHQERELQWQNDLKQTEGDWQLIKTQLEDADDELKTLQHEIERLEPERDAAQQNYDHLSKKLMVAEEEVQRSQAAWDEFNQTAALTTQTAQVEQTRIQHLEQKFASLKKRQEQLQHEQVQFNFSELTKELEGFAKQAYEASDQLSLQNEQLQQVRKEVSHLQSAQQDSGSNLDKVRSELQRLRGQQASLEALQQTALGKRNNPSHDWIVAHQLDTKNRLAQHIEVEKGWEFAVEKVLGSHLQAVCVDSLENITNHLDDFKNGNLCAYVPIEAPTFTEAKPNKSGLLATKIKSDLPVQTLLAGVYAAETMEEGLALCEKLEAFESVMTKDGIWLNRSWLKILREEDPAVGVFQREQELKQLALRIEQMQVTQEELEKNISLRRDQLQKLELQRDTLTQSHSQQQAKSAQLLAQQKMKQERIAELKLQSERFLHEQDDTHAQLQQTDTDLKIAKNAWQSALTQLEEQTGTREALTKAKENSRQLFQNLRQEVNQNKERVHEFDIKLQTSLSQQGGLQQNITRLHAHLASLNDRKITLKSELTSMPPLETIKKSLTRALDKHVSMEVELNTARSGVETLDQDFRHLEEKRQIIEKDINKIRTLLESLRLEWQGWKVKSDTILEQLKETAFKLEDILKELPQDIKPDEWQIKLDQVVQRIARLGPINLVAIDEYATCLERKEYLDRQVADLQGALATLDEAISKIDKETKIRFKETFDKVNERFQELFPTVFGGGKASLELTSDNLLEAGVTTMATPPGKRNSTIYLLSGGEKSLTAIALIFSIFHLNPAPFCLLDEVDAALDDANVLRFTRLVKTMADKTQFLFISHNKLTIEMAEHLIGVTMNEPGVSRLVSVDIEKAISLAGS